MPYKIRLWQNFPLMNTFHCKWHNAKDIKDVSTHVLEQYRSDFSRQRPDQVTCLF
jgi:hypothetical protein